jgi:hypothetical protein
MCAVIELQLANKPGPLGKVAQTPGDAGINSQYVFPTRNVHDQRSLGPLPRSVPEGRENNQPLNLRHARVALGGREAISSSGPPLAPWTAESSSIEIAVSVARTGERRALQQQRAAR